MQRDASFWGLRKDQETRSICEVMSRCEAMYLGLSNGRVNRFNRELSGD